MNVTIHRTSNTRPVAVPIGSLTRLCVALLKCNATDEVKTISLRHLFTLISHTFQVDGHVDPVIRSLEISVVPQIRELGCRLVHVLAEWYTPLLLQLEGDAQQKLL